MRGACQGQDDAMVGGDRGEWRCSTISADMKMSNRIAVVRASTRLTCVIRISMVLFAVHSLSFVAIPQERTTNPQVRQIEDATNRRFLSALAAYKAEQYAAAQHELEPLVKSAPASFEVNELLGLVYVAQGKQSEANRFLAKAVQLKPSVAEAQTALATNL